MARDPINSTDDDARALARTLLQDARFAAIATQGSPAPGIARVAVLATKGGILTLVSDLSQHTRDLRTDPNCAILIGEPGPKGDPLTHPRISITARAETADKSALRDHWLAHHPKSKLYYDFADFRLLRLVPSKAALNGGFGKAYHLLPEDLV